MPKKPTEDFSFYENNSHQNTTMIFDTFFGVEIEAYGINRERLAAILSENNILAQSERYNHATRDFWKVTTDSSIRPSPSHRRIMTDNQTFELVSPKLKLKNDFDTIRKVIKLLNENGALVNNTCGLHVHVDVRHIRDPGFFTFLAYRFMKHEYLIDSFVANKRAENNNRFCRMSSELSLKKNNENPDEYLDYLTLRNFPFYNMPLVYNHGKQQLNNFFWLTTMAILFENNVSRSFQSIVRHSSENYLEENKKIAAKQYQKLLERNWSLSPGDIINTFFRDRYKKLNLSSFLRHGTVEFRQHEATLNENEILAWIMFCINFVTETEIQYNYHKNFIPESQLTNPLVNPTWVLSYLDFMDDSPLYGLDKNFALPLLKKSYKRFKTNTSSKSKAFLKLKELSGKKNPRIKYCSKASFFCKNFFEKSHGKTHFENFLNEIEKMSQYSIFELEQIENLLFRGAAEFPKDKVVLQNPLNELKAIYDYMQKAELKFQELENKNQDSFFMGLQNQL